LTEEIRSIPPKLTPGVFNALVDHGLEACASVIIRKTVTEFEALDGSTKHIIAHGASGQTVFNAGCAAAPKGGLVLLKAATYPPLTLNYDVSVVGEGMSVTPCDPAVGDPDGMITGMFGVVIEVTTPDTNGFTLAGTRSNIRLENIGVKFTGAGTGHGFYSDPGLDKSGLMFSKRDNLFVWGHDKDHYAFYFVNQQHCIDGRLFSFGGPAVHFETKATTLTYGIAIIDTIFARVSTTSMNKNIVEFVGANATARIGGIKVRRLHIMHPTGTNSASCVYMNYALINDIYEYDCEVAAKQLITLENSIYILFHQVFIFGGGILFTMCDHCGIETGYIDPKSGDTAYGVLLSGGGQNYIMPAVTIVPNSIQTNFQRTPTENPSVSEDLADIQYRADPQISIYKDGEYLVLRGRKNLTDTLDHYADAVVMKQYSYGTYVWAAKVANPVARSSAVVGGFQKHFSFGPEGQIIVLQDEGVYYFMTHSEAGEMQLTELTGEDWTTKKIFKLVWTAIDVKLYIDDVLKATHATYTPMSSGMFFCDVCTKNTPWPSADPTTFFQLGSFTVVS
jgi:hypothetical protein